MGERKCRQCGTIYEAAWGAKDWLCSNRCKVYGRRAVDPRTGCWNATTKPAAEGYAWIRTGSRRDGTRTRKQLHRYAYEAFIGPVPFGQKVCHICDNTICCNPLHLFLGTDQDNATDSCRKGRKRKKLRPGDVQEIRRLYRKGVAPTTIAHKYKVSFASVYDIMTGRTWTHLKEDE